MINLMVNFTSSISTTWAQCYKTFYYCNLRMFVVGQSVCPCQFFPDSLMLVSKGEAYQSAFITFKHQTRLERPARGTIAVSIMTFSIMGLFATFSINDIQHNNTLRYAECHYAECRDYSIVTLSFVILSVIMLNVIMLSVIMLSVAIIQLLH